MVKDRNCRVSLRSVALISRLLIDNEATLVFIESQTAYQNLEVVSTRGTLDMVSSKYSPCKHLQYQNSNINNVCNMNILHTQVGSLKCNDRNMY